MYQLYQYLYILSFSYLLPTFRRGKSTCVFYCYLFFTVFSTGQPGYKKTPNLTFQSINNWFRKVTFLDIKSVLILQHFTNLKFNLSCSILVMSSFYEKCSILLLVISKFRPLSSILLISILLRMIPFYNLKISPIQKLYKPFRILLITKLYSSSTNLKISSFY